MSNIALAISSSPYAFKELLNTLVSLLHPQLEHLYCKLSVSPYPGDVNNDISFPQFGHCNCKSGYSMIPP